MPFDSLSALLTCWQCWTLLVLVIAVVLIWSLGLRGKSKRSFFPPRRNGLIVWLTRNVATPITIRKWDKITSVEIDADSQTRLQALHGQRAVLCPNHPAPTDSDTMVYLSTMLGDEWNFMAARDVFDPPLQGWFLQANGVFSVIRGTLDKDAFRTARQLIAAGKRHLVIFPEGETYGRNDILLPFQPGVATFGFWALEDLATAHPGEPLPPLHLVPIAIKYLYSADMEPEMARVLTRLERKLGIADVTGNIHDRLARVGEKVLSTSEREYGVHPAEGAPFGERVEHMKEVIITHVAGEINVTLRPGQLLWDRLRILANALDRQMSEPPATSEYERQLQAQRQQHVKGLYEHLHRVQRFIANYDRFQRETMTVERFMDILIRLEYEVFGKVRWHGPRKVLVRVGEPVSLTDRWEDYQQDKRGTAAAAMSLLEERVRAELDTMTQQYATLMITSAGSTATPA